MSLTISSYNLWFHKAYPEVHKLARAQDLDILCLQECYTDELEPQAGELVLAEARTYTRSPRATHPKPRIFATGSLLAGNIGLALYYHPKRFELEDVSSYQLPLPWQERKGGRTLQLARLRELSSGQTYIVGNIHLSALWSSNLARRKQMLAALEHIAAYRQDVPCLIAGDFNYPIGGLRTFMRRHGYEECGRHDKRRTHTSRLVKGKFDRIFVSRDMQETGYAILPFGASDHAPVLAKVTAKTVVVS